METQRIKLPKHLKDHVYWREGGKCVCCIERGEHFHHINPVALGGQNNHKNIILLCKNHHKLLHLADPETCMQIFEYGYYINTGSLPNDPYSMITAKEVLDMITECY